MTYRDEVLADGPSAYWRLGEPSGATAAVDVLGQNPGTYTALTALGTASLVVNDDDTAFGVVSAFHMYMSVADAAAIRPTAAMTVEGLVSTASALHPTYVARKYSTAGYTLRIQQTTGFAECFMNIGGSLVSVVGAVNLANSKPHHLAGTFDGATIRLYVDGVQVNATAVAGAIGTDASALYVASYAPGSEWATGVVDEVAVYPYALSAGRILAHYATARVQPRTDTQVTIVKFRSPRPPHGTTVTLIPAAIKYGFKVRSQGTASFLVSRADPNVVNFLDRLIPHEPAMVTIERPDGYLPWVGFVTGYSASQADPYATFTCADHTWRLSSPQGARTKKSQKYNAASGQIVLDAFRDMEQRSEPAPLLRYSQVEHGTPVSYELRLDYGHDLLEALAKASNYEWGFLYNVSASAVETQLQWTARVGFDRRDEEVWQEEKHFVRAVYTLNYGNGIHAAIAVGGAGDYASRPAAAASKSGSGRDIPTTLISPLSPYGLQGTRIIHTQQVTDVTALRAMAEQSHEAPEFAVEQISVTILESAVDMSRLGLGDIRTIRLATTGLGVPLERVARIIGISMNADTRQHDLELQVIG